MDKFKQQQQQQHRLSVDLGPPFAVHGIQQQQQQRPLGVAKPNTTTGGAAINGHRMNQPSGSNINNNVLARLQALFPGGNSSVPTASSSSPGPGGSSSQQQQQQQRVTTPGTGEPTPHPPPHPKFLKVRIVTWNMHDSLPKVRLFPLCACVVFFCFSC